MIALKSVIARLEWIMTPPSGPTNDTKIFCPAASDNSPAATFKRDLFARSRSVVDAGKAKLSGVNADVKFGIKEDDYHKINDLLQDDPEQREYFELLHVASTAQLLIKDS